MNLKRSDKAALFLALLLGTIMLIIGLFMDLGGAFKDTPTFHSSGWSGIIAIWLGLCMVIVLPFWLLFRGIGAIFSTPQQRDASFIARRPE